MDSSQPPAIKMSLEYKPTSPLPTMQIGIRWYVIICDDKEGEVIFTNSYGAIFAGPSKRLLELLIEQKVFNIPANARVVLVDVI